VCDSLEVLAVTQDLAVRSLDLQKASQWISVPRRSELHRQGFTDLERIRADLRDPLPG
jgi:hypothetical protein